ncbi:hypothetical protein ACTFIW_000943 [Dictyostelium discoideum]
MDICSLSSEEKWKRKRTNEIEPNFIKDGSQQVQTIEKQPIQHIESAQETKRILNEIHQKSQYQISNNYALDITYNNIRQDYYFKEMFSNIKRYIKSCETCQLNINRKDNGILQSLEIPFKFWRVISFDFKSLPKTMYVLNGFTVEVNQVCVIVCRLSKMVPFLSNVFYSSF